MTAKNDRWSSVVRLCGVAVVVLALGVFTACGGDGNGSDDAPPTGQPEETMTAAPDAGGDEVDAAALYSTSCATCHGSDGEGGVGPDLRPLTADDREGIEQQIRDGGGAMPAFGDQLSDEEIEVLAEYVIGLGQ